jgi:hypothetical protein
LQEFHDEFDLCRYFGSIQKEQQPDLFPEPRFANSGEGSEGWNTNAEQFAARVRLFVAAAFRTFRLFFVPWRGALLLTGALAAKFNARRIKNA